jgi:hypothetical protein
MVHDTDNDINLSEMDQVNFFITNTKGDKIDKNINKKITDAIEIEIIEEDAEYYGVINVKGLEDVNIKWACKIGIIRIG